MNLRRILNWLVPGLPLIGQPGTDLTYGDSVRTLLASRYPPIYTTHEFTAGDRTGGSFGYEFPPLPRGALSRIAEEVGCSRGYAAAVARRAGYEQERRVG